MNKKKLKNLIDKRIITVVSTLLKNYNVPKEEVKTEPKDIIIKGFKKE